MTGLIYILIVLLLLMGCCAVLAFRKFYIVVQPGTALVINGMGGSRVSMTSALVLPLIQRAELIDITTKVIEIQRLDGEGLICLDNLRANAVVRFTLRISPTEQDVLLVAKSIGCARAGTQETLEALFTAKFCEALKTVSKQFAFVDILQNLERFKTDVIQTLGLDLNGFMLEDVAIAEFTQTPIDKLNPNNILDAQAIRKITEITAAEGIKANALKINSQKQLCEYAQRNPEIVRHLANYLKN
ncbi:MAG: putative membrane protein YqiK [Rhodothermales bacterium]|jgi:uncharacterized membrane protein YqiK